MIFDNTVLDLVDFLQDQNQIRNKDVLKELVKNRYSLTIDRKVYYCKAFAIRFSSAKNKNFSNTILSLSALQKYDDRPFIVCAVLPDENYLLLANSSCLKKISHSSKELRIDNIKGSFNGSDIMRNVSGIDNSPENFKDLYLFHEATSFEENLERLVEATNKIVGIKKKESLSKKDEINILNAPKRAIDFVTSKYYNELKKDLENRINKVQNSIAIAAFIDNVNIRGRIIEYLITSESEDETRKMLIDALENDNSIPNFLTLDKLGDYSKDFDLFYTETDIKTKVLFLEANPKAYNIDKLLRFLSTDKSVYMLCFVGVSKDKKISMALVSMFQKELLENTRCMNHWAGKSTRGVTQFYGAVIKNILSSYEFSIDIDYSISRLQEMINL